MVARKVRNTVPDATNIAHDLNNAISFAAFTAKPKKGLYKQFSSLGRFETFFEFMPVFALEK